MAKDAKRKDSGHSVYTASVRDEQGRVAYAATLSFADTWAVAGN